MSLLHPNRAALQKEKEEVVGALFDKAAEADRRRQVLDQGAGFLAANGYKEAAEIITDTYIPRLIEAAKYLEKQACRLAAEYDERLKGN